jgi:hypothetical protein
MPENAARPVREIAVNKNANTPRAFLLVIRPEILHNIYGGEHRLAPDQPFWTAAGETAFFSAGTVL